mmetsp:Transcript_30474/g.83479  ORF Transcript_30474/g.83479 Transcript_30474/m.83479 type:complete len:334 (-) Transcript_30474:402-1403(-)
MRPSANRPAACHKPFRRSDPPPCAEANIHRQSDTSELSQRDTWTAHPFSPASRNLSLSANLPERDASTSDAAPLSPNHRPVTKPSPPVPPVRTCLASIAARGSPAGKAAAPRRGANNSPPRWDTSGSGIPSKPNPTTPATSDTDSKTEEPESGSISGKRAAGASARACRARPTKPACEHDPTREASTSSPPRNNNHNGNDGWITCDRTAASDADIATRASSSQAPTSHARPTATDLTSSKADPSELLDAATQALVARATTVLPSLARDPVDIGGKQRHAVTYMCLSAEVASVAAREGSERSSRPERRAPSPRRSGLCASHTPYLPASCLHAPE